MIVRKPIRAGNFWQVIISESMSPLAEPVEIINCTGREEAWKAYTRTKEELKYGKA